MAQAKDSIDNEDIDIATLLSNSNSNKNAAVQSFIPQSQYDLEKQVARVAEHHQAMVNKSGPILLEMALIYRLALYDAYIRDVLNEFLLFKPEILKSRQTITHREALELFESGTLVEHMAEKELIEFDRSSVKDQVSWIQNKFGFSILPRDTDLPKLIELIARRNLFVHSNGFVDSKYLRAIHHATVKVGERLDVPMGYLVEADNLLIDICHTMVEKASAKLHL